MEYELEGTAQELMTSEQLQVFDVFDAFCTSCGRVTPHHIEGSQKYNNDNPADKLESSSEDEIELCDAISTKECVYCREMEENQLDI
jgi:hypothetical protein